MNRYYKKPPVVAGHFVVIAVCAFAGKGLTKHFALSSNNLHILLNVILPFVILKSVHVQFASKNYISSIKEQS